MDDYERILSVKPEILVYRIPPRHSNRGYRAADWGLDKPSWTGRMRIISKADKVSVKLEDKITGELFAQAPIDTYPGLSVESVTDSSRYFVLKISDGSGRTAFIGIGFADRGDAFDFNVTLQDHFNSIRKDKEIEESGNTQPALDLQLKEGQTFKINLGGKLGSKDRSRPRTNAAPSTGGLLLPPPPGGVAKPLMEPTQQQSEIPAPSANLVGLGQPTGQFNQMQSTSDWGEFSSAPISGGTTDNAQGWVQF